MSEFKCCYEVDDGYVGPSAPLYFNISKDDLYDDMDKIDLEILFEDYMQEDFEMRVCPYGKNKEKFVEWGLKIIEKIKLENEED